MAALPIARELERARDQLPGSEAGWRTRQRAASRFEALGLPGRRIEAWHYTDLSPFAEKNFGFSLPAPDPATLERVDAQLDAIGIDHDTACLVIVDGMPVESLRPAVEPFKLLLSQASEALIVGWPARGRRRQILLATIRHAIDFYTWRSLTACDLIPRGEAVRLATALVEAAAESE